MYIYIYIHIPIRSGGGTYIDTYWSPPSTPIPGISKSLMPGANTLRKKSQKTSLIDHLRTNTNLILGDRWEKYWSLLVPSAIPKPGVSNSLLPGGKNNF